MAAIPRTKAALAAVGGANRLHVTHDLGADEALLAGGMLPGQWCHTASFVLLSTLSLRELGVHIGASAWQ
eukprot:2518910-Amphidinium_carterae.1